MTRCRCRPAGAAGFTLIEVLVALALAGIVSLVLVDGIALAARGLDRLSARAERLDARRSLEMLMRRAFDAALPVSRFAGQPAFVGRPTSLSFLSTVEDGGPGLYRITLALDASGRRPALVFARQLTEPSALPQRIASVLVRDVRVFDIAYFGAAAPSDKPRWHRQWQGLAEWPQLVRITVESAGTGLTPPIVLRVWNAG